MPRPPATLVIFDCDGVLVDTEEISGAVLARTATDAGVPMSAGEAMTAFRGRSIEYVTDTLERRLGRALPSGWTDDYAAARNAAFRTGVHAIDGAEAAARRLAAAGLDVCVASQGDSAKMALTLGLTGLDTRFPAHVRFSAESVAHPKPAPDLFLYAAAAMGHPPDRCVVVEDSLTGVTAGRAAGMRVLAYAAAGDAAALAAAGGEPILDMAEVADRILR